jgi:hypothetical protein
MGATFIRTVASASDEGSDETADLGKKCSPPKPEKPLKPISPGQKPRCEDTTDEGPDIQLELRARTKDLKPGESTTICALAYDCDFQLTYCTYDGIKYWLAASRGFEYYSLSDPSPFTFNWSSSQPLLTPGPPPCATYAAPSSVTKDFDVTITCTVDDPGTLDPRDPAVTQKIAIHIKKK